MNFGYLKAGDKVYVVSIYDRFKSHDGEYFVEKVGKKYLTIVIGYTACKFNIEGGYEFRKNYSGNYRLFFSEAAYIEEQKALMLRRKLASFLNSSKNIPLDALMAAADTVGFPRDDWQI